MTRPAPIGIVSGSGMQSLANLRRYEEHEVDTPFGPPSAPLVSGEIVGVPVVILRRHGDGHAKLPSEINVRANIAALKMSGVEQVLSFSAVGSLEPSAPPGTFVLVDQYIDRTYARRKTYFGDGIVGHVAFGDPVCRRGLGSIAEAARRVGLDHKERGTYVVMEGPQFSTRAEAELHRSFGATVIGMTAMPEPKLSREAELCYNMVAMVTDFDCWHDSHESVSADLVTARMKDNGRNAERLLECVLPKLADRSGPCPCGCNNALDGAIMTRPDKIDAAKRRELGFLLDRVLAGDGSRTEGSTATDGSPS